MAFGYKMAEMMHLQIVSRIVKIVHSVGLMRVFGGYSNKANHLLNLERKNNCRQCHYKNGFLGALKLT